MSNPSSLSSWARNVAPSPTLAVDAKAKALKAAGKDVCGFGVGEPDFDTPQFVKDACAKALAEGQTKYAPTPGIPALRKAIAEDYTRRGFTGIADANVVVSPGGKMSCYLAILATISPGDEVIIPAPFWVSYPEMVKLAGGVPKFINAEDSTGFKITPAQLSAALTPKTRMVVINSPSNPTGAVYSRAELEALVAICVKAKVWILSDEIYENLVYDNQTTCSPATFSPEASRLTITVSGYAKSYSMTGWRLGTLVASDKALAAAVADLQSQISSNATTFAQFGALAVHQHADKAKASLAEMCKVFDRRRLYLLDGLNKIPGLTCYRSQGAFYLFPNIKAFGLSSAEFADRLLEEELMAVVPGSAFGSEGYIRLSYATSDEVLAKGIERLARFCAKLKK
jgi:aspartate aminotransferase